MQISLPSDWATQVYDAVVDVRKWNLAVDTIVLPWAWRDAWAEQTRSQTGVPLFGMPIRFAMIDRPIALIQLTWQP